MPPFDEERARRQADPVLAEFYGGTGCPSQSQLDYLTKRHSIPAMALAQDADGGGVALGAADIEFDGERLFDFHGEALDVETVAALIFVARDSHGDPLDLVAWAPRLDRVALRFGRAVVLGEHEMVAPRIEEPLTARRSLVDWLKAGRSGIVILDPVRAWRPLEGVTLIAADVEHGLELRRTLQPPAPRIVVPTASTRRAA